MKSSASKIKMTSFDDLFDTGGSDEINDKILNIELEKLVDFNNHPFKVLDDEKMEETKGSIEKYGVLVPIIARPKENGKYEIIAGHRRKHACELLEIETIPTLVRDLDDEESTIVMVDSNIQRENLLYSEKAFAFKMKLEAIKRQGKRNDLTSCQVGEKLTSVDKISENTNESARTIQRYIRLTELNMKLLDMVDKKKLAFNTGVELSYLTNEEQEMLLEKMKELNIIPSMFQATKLKKYSNEKTLTNEVIDVILLENTKSTVNIKFKADKLNKYFPNNYSSAEIEKAVLEIVEEWHRKK